MKRLGLVTYSNTYDNYGQMLQSLATIDFFKELEYDVYLLRRKQPLIFHIKKMVHSVLQFLKLEKPNDFQKWGKIVLREHKAHPRYFEDFRKKYFNMITVRLSDVKKMHFDLFVAGSDQIWSWANEFMFMNFGTSNVPKISIAPGIGIKQYKDKEIEKIKEYLKDYNFITVRENAGKEMCRRAGRDADVVLDPTFLVSSSHYDKYIEDMHINEDYLFLYLLGAKTDLDLDTIYKFAEDNYLTVKYVASQGRVDDKDKIYATLPQWLYLMKHAKYVITNSFHGMALSINYHKQFLVLPIVGETKKNNERIETLSEIFNLGKHIYSGNIEVIKEEIDYTFVDSQVLVNKDHIFSLLDKVKMT